MSFKEKTEVSRQKTEVTKTVITNFAISSGYSFAMVADARTAELRAEANYNQALANFAACHLDDIAG